MPPTLYSTTIESLSLHGATLFVGFVPLCKNLLHASRRVPFDDDHRRRRDRRHAGHLVVAHRRPRPRFHALGDAASTPHETRCALGNRKKRSDEHTGYNAGLDEGLGVLMTRFGGECPLLPPPLAAATFLVAPAACSSSLPAWLISGG